MRCGPVLKLSQSENPGMMVHNNNKHAFISCNVIAAAERRAARKDSTSVEGGGGSSSNASSRANTKDLQLLLDKVNSLIYQSSDPASVVTL